MKGMLTVAGLARLYCVRKLNSDFYWSQKIPRPLPRAGKRPAFGAISPYSQKRGHCNPGRKK